MNNSLSISYYTAPELSPLKLVESAAKLKCKFIGLRLLSNQPGADEMPLLNDLSFRKVVKKNMKSLGGYSLDANSLRIIPDSNVSDYLNFFDAAWDLNAKHVLTTINDNDENRLMDNLNKFCEEAIQRQLTIDIEFVPWLKVSNLKKTIEIINKCNFMNVGIALDALHFFRSNSSLDLLKKYSKKHINYFQICDAKILNKVPKTEQLIIEATKNRLSPGNGDINLKKIIDLLPKNIPFAIEIPQADKYPEKDPSIKLEMIVNEVKTYLKSLEI